MSASDLAARILACDDLDSETVEVAEWGVTLKLVTPTGEERATLASAFKNIDDDDDEGRLALMFPTLLAMCAHDPDTGERVFTSDQIGALAKKNGAVVWRLGETCQRLAGMTADAVDEAGKDTSSS